MRSRTTRAPTARCATSRRARACHAAERRAAVASAIEIHGAREHNLKNVDVKLGLNKFTVITGVSGSGKSTLAFDILFAEGQRRYLESLNAYARQFVQPASRPDVDAIFGIPPTVAIEQRTSRGGHKSTVATLTEIYHFLRLLFVKLGVQYCPDCEVPHRAANRRRDRGAHCSRSIAASDITLLAPLIVARKGLYTALAKWARGKGFSHLRVDGSLIPTKKWPRLDRFVEHNIELPVAELKVGAANEASCVNSSPRRCSTAAAWCTSEAGSAKPQASCFLHQARLSELRHRISGTRSAAVLLQLEARLVQGLLRHGIAIAAIRCRAKRRGIGVARRHGCAAGSLPAMRRAAAEPIALAVLFRGRSIAALTDLPVQEFCCAACETANWPGANATSRATCSRNSHRAPLSCAMSAWGICS